MKHLLFAILCISLVACHEEYSIKGSTSIERFEGEKLYLKHYDGAKLQCIDSCQVRHGAFCFAGRIDSVELVMIFYNEQVVMPVMLENAKITVEIADGNHQACGSLLNDSLFAFINRKAALDRQLMEIPSRLTQLIMDGADYNEVEPALALEAAELKEACDREIIEFIKQNINNPLGAGVFMLVTRDNVYPLLSPAIEEILANAGATFRNNSYVAKYIETAEENMILRREGKELIQM